MLWTLNFFISTAIVAVWGFVIARIPFNKLVPGIYTFFATSFVFLLCYPIPGGSRPGGQEFLYLGECVCLVPRFGILELYGRYL